MARICMYTTECILHSGRIVMGSPFYLVLGLADCAPCKTYTYIACVYLYINETINLFNTLHTERIYMYYIHLHIIQREKKSPLMEGNLGMCFDSVTLI